MGSCGKLRDPFEIGVYMIIDKFNFTDRWQEVKDAALTTINLTKGK
jgi:hypothetical protein